MTGAADPLFLDTNVLVSASVLHAPYHSQALQAIQTAEQAGGALWISRQVLREYLAVLTRPQTFTAPVAHQVLTAQVRQFEQRFHVAEDHQGVTAHLLTLLGSIAVGGKQVHDANIIATMQTYGIGRLLTHNMGDFARFASIVTIVPLVHP